MLYGECYWIKDVMVEFEERGGGGVQSRLG